MIYNIIVISKELNVENIYLHHLCKKLIEKNIYKKILVFDRTPTKETLTTAKLQSVEDGNIYKLNSRTKKIFLDFLDKLIEQKLSNTLIVFNKPTLDLLNLADFCNSGIYDCIVVRNTLFLYDFEKQMKKDRFTVEIFPTNSSFDVQKLTKDFGNQNVLAYYYANWKANKEHSENNKLVKIPIDALNHKLLMNFNEMEKDFSEFAEFIKQPSATAEAFYELYGEQQ